MSTTETERYVRITLLTFEGGIWISKKILFRDIYRTPGSPTIDTLLLSKTPQLKQKRRQRHITKRQYETLFPTSGVVTDVNAWDLSLLIKIVLFLFEHSLPGQESNHLNEILRIRNEVVCHARHPSVQEQEFNTHWTQLTICLCDLASAFDANTQQYAHDLILRLSSGPLDLQSSIEKIAQLCQNDEHMEQVLASLTTLQRRLNEVASGVDEANRKLEDLQMGVRELIRIQGQYRVEIQKPVKTKRRRRSRISGQTSHQRGKDNNSGMELGTRYAQTRTERSRSELDSTLARAINGTQALVLSAEIHDPMLHGPTLRQMTPIADPPGEPSQPRVSDVTASSCVLEWTQPEDDGGSPVERYHIQFRAGGISGWAAIGGTKETRHQVTRLTPGTVYQFRVAAENTADVGVGGPESDYIQAAQPPDMPSKPEVLESSRNHCLLSWKPPQFSGGSGITGYHVEYRTTWPETRHWARVTNGIVLGNQYTVRDVLPVASYYFRIVAVNKIGEGNPGIESELVDTIDPPGDVEAPVVRDITTASCVLSWRPPDDSGGAPVLGYHVEQCRTDSFGWMRLTDTLTPGTSFTARDLIKNSKYRFRIIAVNKKGEGGEGYESAEIEAIGSTMSDRQELSLRLNDVLEMVGVTEEMRSYHRRRATMNDIALKVHAQRNTGQLWNLYQCGSSWEATVTPDLASDIDTIVCPSEPPVVTHRAMAGPGVFLHTVRDDWTRPGYVKLQLMMDGRALTVNDVEESDTIGFDGEGRTCHKHVTTHDPVTMHVNDDILAFQCKCIPLFATEWITRHREYEWPSQQLIDELKMMDCLFVGVGHFESRDKELEWKLVFSLQEKMLMKSLNITQHRVYVILKMIRKDILEKCLSEESLSSYHCKTCVFYMVETTPVSMWVPENIIDCLLQCLSLLLRWIRDRFCPSFFLKDSNLFDKEGFLRLAGPLERLLATLLHMGHEFLYSLQSDRVGEMLRVGDLRLYKPSAESSITKYMYFIDQQTICRSISSFRSVRKPYNPEQDTLSSYMTELEDLCHGESFPDHSEEEYITYVRLALPWLHLSIGLEFAARAVTCSDRQEGRELVKKVDHHMQLARNTDLVNGRLAQATLLLRLEKLEACALLLQELENCWLEYFVTFCPCTHRCATVYQDEQQYLEIAAECRNMSLRKHVSMSYASCVIFERSQIELIPVPLRYEMYRSIYTRPGSRRKVNDALFDRAAVDAKVYLYLLQYTLCSKLNREPHKQIAIDNLASITLHDGLTVLNHRETAFNLLGWVYLQEHRVTDAMWCFLQSWQIRPHHNAAKFHMLVESFKQAQAQSLQQNNT